MDKLNLQGRSQTSWVLQMACQEVSSHWSRSSGLSFLNRETNTILEYFFVPSSLNLHQNNGRRWHWRCIRILALKDWAHLNCLEDVHPCEPQPSSQPCHLQLPRQTSVALDLASGRAPSFPVLSLPARSSSQHHRTLCCGLSKITNLIIKSFLQKSFCVGSSLSSSSSSLSVVQGMEPRPSHMLSQWPYHW